MTPAASRAPLKPALLLAAGVAATGLIAAALAGALQARRNDAAADQALARLADNAVVQIQARLNRYDAGLRGMRGAVVAGGGGNFRLDQMRAYIASRDMDREFPGARGFGVIWRVPQAREAEFVARVRKDGRPDFEVRQFKPQPGERRVITYVEPVERNRAALGMDIASEPVRQRAADAAMRSGEATLTSPITLVQSAEKPKQGLLLMLPIYKPHASLGTTAERERATEGWAYAPLVVDEVLAGLEGEGSNYLLGLSAPPPDDSQSRVQFRGEAAAVSLPGLRLPSTSRDFEIHGQRWHARLQATPEFLVGLNQTDPSRTAGAIGLTSMLLATVAYLVMAGRARSLRERLEVARRAAIVEGSDDAIIGATLEGTITEWNSGAERLFGYTAAQALGATAEALLLPDDCLADEATFRAVIASGRRVPPFDTFRRHRDGTLIAVSLTAGPILDSKGRCVGMAKTVRDIREAHRARAELAALNASLEQQVASRTAALVTALRDKTALLQTLDRFAIVSEIDRDGRIVQVNESFRRISGFSNEEVIGRRHDEFAVDADDTRVPPIPWDPLQRGESWRGEIRNRARDGSEYWLDSIVAPLLHADGSIEKFISISADVTPIKLLQQEAERARLAAEEANRFLQEVTDRLPLRIAYLDQDHRFLFVNAAQCQAYGKPREEILGTRPRVFEPGSPLAHLAPHFDAVRQGQPQIYEAEFPFRHGGSADFEVRLVPNQREDGTVPGYYAVATDISVRKRAEQELRRTLTTLRAVLDSATQVSILSVGLDGRINLFNRGAEQLTGYSADEAIGRKALELLHDPEQVEARRLALQAQLGEPVGKNRLFVDASQLGQDSEWQYRRKDGSRVPVSLAVTRILDDAGNLVGLLGIAHDVSARREIEQSLREAMHRANQANQAKSEFLANMSHEIRTPMNAVIGLSYLLGHTTLTPEQASFVNKIKLASNSLLGIINDVLDLSKIEAAEMHVERAPFSLPALLDELGAWMSVQALAKGIDFSVERPADLAHSLEGDATRVRQVLTNLLSNAIKFTSQGEVRLIVKQDASPGPGQAVTLSFTVKDTGIGVPADALERIFQPFAQADASTTRRYGGTGLGLSIVRQLTALMGGRVDARSEPGHGSEFTVQLSLPRSETPVLPPEPMRDHTAERALTGVRLLVVDDSPLNLEVARRILELEGAIVTLAEDGQQAVDCLIAAPEGYDLVLMDMQMPVLDGHDATRRIRSGLGLTGLPIVALTAGVTVGEQQRAAAAGMNDLLGKPFEPEGLVGCILRHTGRARRQPARPALPPRAAPAWPAIDGLDMPDAQRRLGGDLDLFRSLLRRMLQEFADLETPRAPAADALPELARRLHKLKGTAGTLGAQALERAAGTVEQASQGASLSAVAPGLIALAEQLRHLRENASDFLAEPEAEVPTPAGTAGLDPAVLRELVALLKGHDLAALQHLERLRPALRQRMPADDYEQLRRHVDDLNFSAALRLLTPLT